MDRLPSLVDFVPLVAWNYYEGFSPPNLACVEGRASVGSAFRLATALADLDIACNQEDECARTYHPGGSWRWNVSAPFSHQCQPGNIEILAAMALSKLSRWQEEKPEKGAGPQPGVLWQVRQGSSKLWTQRQSTIGRT